KWSPSSRSRSMRPMLHAQEQQLKRQHIFAITSRLDTQAHSEIMEKSRQTAPNRKAVQSATQIPAKCGVGDGESGDLGEAKSVGAAADAEAAAASFSRFSSCTRRAAFCNCARAAISDSTAERAAKHKNDDSSSDNSKITEHRRRTNETTS